MKVLAVFLGLLLSGTVSASVNLEYVTSEFNHNLLTPNTAIQYIGHKKPEQAELLKKYLKENSIEGSTKFPTLIESNGVLYLSSDVKKELAIKPSENGGVEVHYKNKKVDIKTTMTIQEAYKELKKFATKDKTSYLDLVIPTAHADGGILEVGGMLIGGTAIAVGAVVLYSTAAVVDTVNSIPKGINEYFNGRLRNQAFEACSEIKSGKVVKSADKIRVKLEKLKKDDPCVEGWDSRMWHSCAWYDQHLACLASGDGGINDSKREAKESDFAGEHTAKPSSASSPK